MTTEPQPTVELERQLGKFDATMIIVGNIIGMGIFTTTGFIAEVLPHPLLMLSVWIAGGLLTLCGALTYAELGAAIPRAGGEYVYLREAYGPLMGFLNGWTYFLVSNPGSIAVMSVALVAYTQSLVPGVPMQSILIAFEVFNWKFQVTNGQVLSIVVVGIFSVINYLGVRLGSWVQNLLTMVKIGAILTFAGLGFILGNGNWSNFNSSSQSHSASVLLAPWSLAMISVFFSYTGWFTSTYVASEIKDPEKNIPHSIIYGTLIVTLMYTLINGAYIYAIPPQRMRGMISVAESAAAALFGMTISKYVSAAIVVSVLGAINSVILTSPRIYYAMAKDGLFFQAAGRVHPVFKTPANSILLQGFWSAVLVLSGTFGQLLTYTTVAMLAFSVLTGTAVLVLRRTQPSLPRPFHVPCYPWLTIVFVLSYIVILANILFSRPREALAGIGIVLLGIPAYLFWSRKRTY